MANRSRFVEVLLPLPIPGTFTYSVPEEWQSTVVEGQRVIVPFGSRKQYTGIITHVEAEGTSSGIRPILAILDNASILDTVQLTHWAWMAGYYFCTTGEVLRAALPSSMKPNEERSSEGSISRREGDEIITLNPAYSNEEALNRLYQTLSRAPSQARLLDRYLLALHPSDIFVENRSDSPPTTVPVKEIIPGIPYHSLITDPSGRAAFKALAAKGVFSMERAPIQRATSTLAPIHRLSPSQEEALQAIRQGFKTKDTLLLHGLTASGKTEIYFHLMQEAIDRQQQVLYLLPEIAITTQLTERIRAAFGNRVGVFHSRCSGSEQARIWQSLLTHDGCDIILGARSALFLPFPRLGLVIIDEEHEPAFRQTDPAPRYHARDSAIVLAKMHKAKTLLGSATPSVESYYNARQGKYGFVSLRERYQATPLPRIVVADMAGARKSGLAKGLFHPILLKAIEEALAAGEQTILFQNRRGFSPSLQCTVCGHVPGCKHCNVSLTYHKASNRLLCHYCGYSVRVPGECPECHNRQLKTMGSGTEQIENEIALCFPGARVARMDFDTTRSKKSYQKLLHQMEQGHTDILIGTQMVAKGLDFPNVSTVGIIYADQLFFMPDFRAHERAFQLMMQVGGRAGRREEQGKVIIQTYHTKNPVITYLQTYNDIEFLENQLIERSTFGYPPFSRLIKITLKQRTETTVRNAALHLAALLRNQFAQRVMGPEAPPIERTFNLFMQQILLKTERNSDMLSVRSKIGQAIESTRLIEAYRQVTITAEADPY
ncbi:MAG: primosomal protein N' [Bacteroidales bacterium]